MLLQFSVENFLSIKDKITLSLIASKDKSLDHNIIKTKNVDLLKITGIYGPNASGKTNILRAIAFLFNLIKTSHITQPGDLIPITPFRLDSSCAEKPSKFELIFIWIILNISMGLL
jgi:AAA15 family ATPase/GTPase